MFWDDCAEDLKSPKAVIVVELLYFRLFDYR